METLIILCEKCGGPNVRSEYHPVIRNHKPCIEESYHCADCKHIEVITPEDLTEVPQTMYANY